MYLILFALPNTTIMSSSVKLLKPPQVMFVIFAIQSCKHLVIHDPNPRLLSAFNLK